MRRAPKLQEYVNSVDAKSPGTYCLAWIGSPVMARMSNRETLICPKGKSKVLVALFHRQDAAAMGALSA